MSTVVGMLFVMLWKLKDGDMISKKKMLIEEIENLKLENERLKADVHLRDEWNKLFMGIIESLHLWLMGTDELCMDSGSNLDAAFVMERNIKSAYKNKAKFKPKEK